MCQKGWKTDEDHCYQVFSGKCGFLETWDEARNKCKATDKMADLASIITKEENEL